MPPWTALGWAAFLACSWTWCIGMYLPIILLRDFGWWGYIAFLVPNIIGAGAMGFVLDAQLSRSVVVHHAVASRAFSLVTRAFQAFFLTWLVTGVLSAGQALTLAVPIAVAFIVGTVLGVTVYRTPGAIHLRAALLWLTSAGIAAYLLFTGSAVLPIIAQRLPQTDVLWLAPVMVLGFLLCPYLDLTFHAALQHAQAAGAGQSVGPDSDATNLTPTLAARARRTRRVAFAVGFGLLFAAMIAFTPFYAAILTPMIDPAGGLLAPHTTSPAASAAGLALTLVLIHIAGQLGYTLTVHNIRPVLPTDSSTSDRPIGTLKIAERAHARNATLAGVLVGLIALNLPPYTSPLTGTWFIPASLSSLPNFEIAYRLFMAFYGLVFPAYVWLVMLPFGSPLERRRVKVWLFACGVAAPCYWLGFIDRQTEWLLPGVMIVLAAKLLVKQATAVNRD